MSRITSQLTITVGGLRGPGLSGADAEALDGYVEAAQGFSEQSQLSAGEAQAIAAGLNIFITDTRYLFGSKVLWGVRDDNGNVPLAALEDGRIVANLAVRGAYGFGVGLSALDGSIEFDPSTMALPAYMLSGGGSIAGDVTYYYNGYKVVWAVGHGASSPLFVDEEGVTHAKSIEVETISGPGIASLGTTSPAIGDTHIFRVEAIDGRQQIFATPLDGTAKVQFTSSGGNYAPVIRDDKVIYWSTRDGSQRAYWANEDLSRSGSTIEHPVRPNLYFMPLGNSIMAGGWMNAVSSHFGVPLIVPAASTEGGIGSQRAEQIGARYGAAGFAGAPVITASVSGDQIGAGSNLLTAISNPLLSRAADAVGTVRSLKAWWAGVHGILTSTQKASADSTTIAPIWGMDNYTYTFTPDAGQSLPVAVPAGSVITIDPEGRQDCILVVDIARNNVGQGAGWGEVVKTWLRAILTVYKPLVKQILVLGGTNRTTEYATATGNNAAGYPLAQCYADLVALNPQLQTIAEEFGALFYDPRPLFNAGTANDVPRADYTDDGLHPNVAGNTNAFSNPSIADIEAASWSFEVA